MNGYGSLTNMNRLFLLASAGITLATSFTTAYATEAGMYDPWLRDVNTEVQTAVWDTFTESYSSGSGPSTLYSYAGTASPGSTLTGLSLTQGLPHINETTGSSLGAQGAGLLSADVYYASTRANSWTLTAISMVDVTNIVFQIKTANLGSVAKSVFLPTLVGTGTASFVQSRISTPGELLGGFQAYVVEYRWTGLDIAAGESFSITFGAPGGSSNPYSRKPLDFVALDAVPEPSTYALIGLGLGLVLWKGRRALKRA